MTIPSSYGEAARLLNDKGRDKLTVYNNTVVERSTLGRNDGEDAFHLLLHGHCVISWYRDGRVVLDSCGFRSVTTKDRLNRGLGQLGKVFQVRGQWFLQTVSRINPEQPSWRDPEPFFDGITVEDPAQGISYHYDRTSKPDGPTGGNTGD